MAGNPNGNYAFRRERERVHAAVREITTESGMFLVRAGVENVYRERHPEAPPLAEEEVYYAVDNVVFNTFLPLPNGFNVRAEVVDEVRSIYQASGRVGLAVNATVELVKMFVQNVNINRHRQFIREAVEQKVRNGVLKFEKEDDPVNTIPEGDEEEEEEEEEEEAANPPAAPAQ